MDLLSTFFLILIVLMSGGIAVLADDLGRRLGKKRLHFRGIRPKRVAQIGTFLAGVIVSLLTIIIVSIASSGVRQWIVAGAHALELKRAAEADRDKIQIALTDANTHLRTLNTQNAKAQAELENSQRTKIELGRQSKVQMAEIAKQRAELTRLNGQISTLTPKIRLLQARVTAADVKVAGLDKRLVEGKKLLANVHESLTDVQTRLKTATAEMNENKKQNFQLFQQNADLEKQRDKLIASNADLEKQKDALVLARDAAEEDLRNAHQELSDTQMALGSTKAQLARTQNELDEAEKAYISWKTIASSSRVAPMIYRMGQEVTRLSIPAGISYDSAENQVVSLLRSARLVALKAGAKPNGNIPEAGLFGQEKSEEDVKRELVSKIAGAAEPMVLVATSVINAFKGEPVALNVVVYPNPVVYKRGDVVAETRIDGRKDQTTIYHQIADLGEQVLDKAKKDKMIPRTGSDELYGAVSSDDVLKLLGDVKAADRSVRVRAVADGDIRAGDQLKVSFIIR